MQALHTFAALLGLPRHLAEDALYSERAARALLSRRGLFIGTAALACGSVLAGGPLPLHVYSDGSEWYIGHNLDDAYETRGGGDPWMDPEDYPLEELKDTERLRIWCNPEGQPDEIQGDGCSVLERTMADWCRRQGRGFLATTES